jgi:hypothetical protein
MASSEPDEPQKDQHALAIGRHFLGQQRLSEFVDDIGPNTMNALVVGRELRRRRLRLRYSQLELAPPVGSTEAQIAKLEAAESEVPLRLLFRALFAVGVKFRDVGRVLCTA